MVEISHRGLGPNQLNWLRQHLIKDGVAIFEFYEKTPVVRLDEQTLAAIRDSRKGEPCVI